MHIQIYDNTLNKEECESIIEYFDRSPYKSKGLTSMGNNQYGVNESFKRSTDITLQLSNEELPDKIIRVALTKGVDKYVKKFPFLTKIDYWNLSTDYNIQKYIEDEGYYEMHCEHNIPHTNRILAWMIYLNDAKCGTRFYYPTRDIRAKRGRLVIWPAFWTHPHSGITPNRGVKYISSGWCNFH